MKRLPEIALCASMLLVVAAGSRLAGALPVWHEVVSALPNHPPRVLTRDGVFEPGCAEGRRWIISASRPQLALCLGSQALPLMVTPYASSLVTWPLAPFVGLHHDDTFYLRQLWLVVAALSLVLTFTLVRRVAGRETAALVCVATAASSPYLVTNAALVPFETIPCSLSVAALACWADLARPAGPRPSRLTLGALFAGLAVACNLKALFLLVPVLLATRGAGLAWRALRADRLAAMLLIFLLPLVPFFVFAAFDPHEGLRQQLAMRGANLSDNLRWQRLADEPLRLLNFAADVGSYFDLALGAPVRWRWPHLVVAPPLLWCMAAAVARAAGRRLGSRLSQACGAVLLTYFFVSALLYRQLPGGNYAPLHEVFGIAIAAGVIDLATLALGATRRRWWAASLAVAATAAVALVVTMGGGDFERRVRFSINPAAERAAADWLRRQPDAALPIYTTTYNIAGVFDALGQGALQTVQVHELLASCEKTPDVAACMVGRWRTILRPERLPLRLLMPTASAVVDKPHAVVSRLEATLRDAAAELAVVEEARFATSDGYPVLAVMRVAPLPNPLPASRGEGIRR